MKTGQAYRRRRLLAERLDILTTIIDTFFADDEPGFDWGAILDETFNIICAMKRDADAEAGVVAA